MVDKLTRDMYALFLDTTRGAVADTYTWERIGFSTVFELAFNPQTEDRDYILYPATQTELTSYKPTLPQEIALFRGDPMYDFMEKQAQEMDVSKSTMPFLFVFPKNATSDPTYPALLYKDAQVPLDTMAVMDGKITFTINMNGEKTPGTVALTDGKPVFTPTAP